MRRSFAVSSFLLLAVGGCQALLVLDRDGARNEAGAGVSPDADARGDSSLREDAASGTDAQLGRFCATSPSALGADFCADFDDAPTLVMFGFDWIDPAPRNASLAIGIGAGGTQGLHINLFPGTSAVALGKDFVASNLLHFEAEIDCTGGNPGAYAYLARLQLESGDQLGLVCQVLAQGVHNLQVVLVAGDDGAPTPLGTNLSFPNAIQLDVDTSAKTLIVTPSGTQKWAPVPLPTNSARVLHLELGPDFPADYGTVVMSVDNVVLRR